MRSCDEVMWCPLAWQDDRLAAVCYKVGAEAVLRKPVDIDAIESIVLGSGGAGARKQHHHHQQQQQQAPHPDADGRAAGTDNHGLPTLGNGNGAGGTALAVGRHGGGGGGGEHGLMLDRRTDASDDRGSFGESVLQDGPRASWARTDTVTDDPADSPASLSRGFMSRF